jgi:6-pyruvoyl tetrahydropterin synthase/QueD family protein
MTTATLDVLVTFEAAHRLPALGGKCANLHGHSWRAEFTLGGTLDAEQAIIADAGEIKARLRDWVDSHLDHAALLGAADSLITALYAEKCRIYVFGLDGYTEDLNWPSTEAVAALLFRVAEKLLADLGVVVIGARVGEAPSIWAAHP